MGRLKVAVVDDELLARERLSRLLAEAGCDVVAEFSEGASLLAWYATHPKVDVLFLDIQMPGITGLELLAEISDPPAVVFVTAFPEFAIMAFELSAVDYLVKPIYSDRLAKSLEKIQKWRWPLLNPDGIKKNQRFVVKAGNGKIFLELKQTSHFESERGIVWAWCRGKRFRSAWSSLGEVEKEFVDAGLVRIQRNLLLRPHAVTGYQPIGTDRIKVKVNGGQELEVSRTTTPLIKKALGIL